jgi:hypothetical protein
MRKVVAGILIVIGWCPGAAAQPRLILSGQGPMSAGSPTATIAVNLGRMAVEWAESTPLLNPLVTADGRYVIGWGVASPPPAVWIRDLATGFTSVATLDGHVPAVIVAHGRRLELFALMTDGLVASITPGAIRPLANCEQASGLSLSGDSRRLVVVCAQNIVLLDADSGAEITRVPTMAVRVDSPVANMDGTRVLVREMPAFGRLDLAVWDVATATRLAQNISPPLSASLDESLRSVIAATPSRDAVVVGTMWTAFPGLYGHRSLVVDATSLAVRQELPIAPSLCKVGVSGPCREPRSAAFTADGRHVVIGAIDAAHGSSGAVQIVDVAANTIVASTGEGFFATDDVRVALASAPLPPAGVAAQVAGRDVTVSWALPLHSPAASGYVIEAGSAPGLSNLAILTVTGDRQSITCLNVPPGRYYLRVRAVNVTGRSDASAETVVEVS